MKEDLIRRNPGAPSEHDAANIRLERDEREHREKPLTTKKSHKRKPLPRPYASE